VNNIINKPPTFARPRSFELANMGLINEDFISEGFVKDSYTNDGFTLVFTIDDWIYLHYKEEYIKLKLSHPITIERLEFLQIREKDKLKSHLYAYELHKGNDKRSVEKKVKEILLIGGESWEYEPYLLFTNHDIVKLLVLLYIQKICQLYDLKLSVAPNFYLFNESIIFGALSNANLLLTDYNESLYKDIKNLE
jgi:hypothetical protein